ncbi:MAG TPA: isoleucine--tRNA ligase [Bacteroidota bacterium]|nr:isoleucine--tRNA ligase [Bacteroidota bacterium]
MFKELTDKINYSQVELEILKFWKEQKIFEKSVSTREGKPGFTFYEGPPTANGRPGIHHVMSRTLKDLVCRYKTMCGFQVHRKAGWDTHGLPVEIEVEKMLGFKHKDDIVKYGIAKFNDECKKSVWKYKKEWEEMTERMGYWVDMSDPYITFENNYIESIWWALKQYFDKGMIYKGYKIQPYCPRCETPLSSHEVSLGYEDVKDPSIYVKMKVKGEDNTYFLVWTTTPWTLISNVALAVHPDVDYVKVEHKDQKIILAEARLGILDGEYSILEKFKGNKIASWGYERLFSYHQTKEKGWYVVEADFVTTEDGSGIVHLAPAYGEDDYQTAKKYGLPTIHPVNKSGEFGPEVTDFAGMFVKDADPKIIRNLKERHLLYKKETITHNYPHCWRCKTPLLYYARESWYIATTKYAARMVELNKTINWYPSEVGEGRFGNWLEENKDWSLSRDRFWGTPLPIWVCTKCGKQKCVGSIAEVKEGRGWKEPLDLHKPFVDEVTFGCTCGGEMLRTPELIDVWFDSGAMPFAQWHYPFENLERFKDQHPADYICEGVDQTRGWFYSLHSISTFLFDKPAYRNLIVNELILDKEGQKMSKSKGNTVDPFEIIEKYGADTTRWYLVATSPPWRPTLFDKDGLVEVQRKFFSTLLNTYAFFSLYANIDGFSHSEQSIPVRNRPEIDRWILSALNSLVKRYKQAMDEYDVTRAARDVSEFTIDELSNWYVRRNRRRFWSKTPDGRRLDSSRVVDRVVEKNGPVADKISAYQTLYECLITITKLMAPFAPFISEELYRNLNGITRNEQAESVHLTMLPDLNEAMIDLELEERMSKAQRIVSLVRAIRNKSNIKVRQPLPRVIVPVANQRDRETVSRMENVILDEINVKKIEYVSDDSEIVHKVAKPNFKVLGPKHGKSVQNVATAIRKFGPKEIKEVETNGKLSIPINGSTTTVMREDVEIIHEDIKGWMVESDNDLIVALDIELTEDLIDEGYAREFVNRVQNMRKDAGFSVTDRIRIYYEGSERLTKAIQSLKEYIQNETLAVKFDDTPPPDGYATEVDLNSETCAITIARHQSNGG